MKPIADRDPFKLGLAALAGLAVLGLILVLLASANFGKKTYTAVLEQSAGLKASEPVQIAGVDVGKVTAVKIVGDTVQATFTVDSGVHLGSRTTAAVKVATLLGSHLLDVEPAGAGELANGTIPMADTTVPFNLQDVLQQGTQRIEQLNAPAIAKLLSTMSDTLAGSTQDFAPALEGVTRLSDVVASRSDQFGALLKAAKSVSNELSSGSGDLITLMKQTNLVVSEVTARRDAIHTLLVESTRLAGNVNALIGNTQADITPALQALNGALTELRHQDKTLRGVLQTMAPAMRYLANATGNGPYVDLTNHAPLIPANDGCSNAILGVACK